MGQVLKFDKNNHNGVFDRVMAFENIKNGKQANDEVSKLILSNFDYWSKVCQREIALEKVRQEKYPNLPSRLSCMYVTHTFEEAKSWAKLFRSQF